MKLKFKKQAYQTNAVEAVANCFAGQHGYIRLHIYPSDSDFFRCFIGFGFLSESWATLSSVLTFQRIVNWIP